MNFIDPSTSDLTDTQNDITYAKSFYKPFINSNNINDEVYDSWDGVISKNTSEYIIVDELKTIYRSTIDSNTTYPPANMDKWVSYGTVNSYSMFASDEDIGSKTTFNNGMMEFDFSRSTSIVGIDLSFISANVYQFETSTINYLSDYVSDTTYIAGNNDAVFYNGKLYSCDADSTGNLPTDTNFWTLRDDLTYFSDEIIGKDIGCLSFGDYYYTDATQKNRVILTGLTWLPSSILRIDISGSASIGSICYGKLEDFGATLNGTSLGYEDNSQFTVNEFTGFRNVIRQGVVRTLDIKITYEKANFNVFSQSANKIMGKNVIWIPAVDEKFSEFITLGYVENLDVPVNEFDIIETQSKIIGVSK